MIAPEIEPKLSEAQVRVAVLSHIANHCCYGKTAAKNMCIKKILCIIDGSIEGYVNASANLRTRSLF